MRIQKWKRRLAKTSVSHPSEGSFYTQYLVIFTSDDIECHTHLCFTCAYTWDNENKDFKLQVTKDTNINGTVVAKEIIKEYPHESKYMKLAKELVMKEIEKL